MQQLVRLRDQIGARVGAPPGARLGDGLGGRYVYVYLASLPVAAAWSQATVIDMLDTAFALMAIPTLIGTLLLSRKVVAAARDYFDRMQSPVRTTGQSI